MKAFIKILTIFVVLITTTQVMGQTDTTKVKIEPFLNFDVVSSYVWRGVQLDNRPNIQPIVGINYCCLTVGALASISTVNQYYEIDPFVTYTHKSKWFKITATDFFVDMTGGNQKYYNYTDTAMYHTIVGDVIIGNPEKFPIVGTISTIAYGGLDKDVNNNQNYTTYFEVAWKKKQYEVFVGAITGESMFYMNDKDQFSVCNVGAKLIKEIKVTNDFTIPVAGSLVMNPTAERFHFVLSVSF